MYSLATLTPLGDAVFYYAPTTHNEDPAELIDSLIISFLEKPGEPSYGYYDLACTVHKSNLPE